MIARLRVKSKRNKYWLIPLILGGITVVGVFIINKSLHPVYSAEITGMAESMGLPANECQALKVIEDRAELGKVTEADWTNIKNVTSRENAACKVWGLGTMRLLRKSKYQPEIAKYTENALSGTDSFERSQALITLAWNHDSRWKSLAQSWSASSDVLLKSTSQSLLAKKERYE